MELKLSDDVLEDIKTQAIREAKDQLTTALINEILNNKEQLKREIKSQLIKESVNVLANRIQSHYRINDSVEKALSSVEGRINTMIKNKLQAGITVRFNEN